jgi:hypothetical protein
MKKLISMVMLVLAGVVVVGCMADGTEETDGKGDTTVEAPEVLGTATEAISGTVCVDQSYASASGISCDSADWFMTCDSQPNWTTQLSRNHRGIIIGCNNATYVYMRSYWNSGQCYKLRRDALRNC